MKTRLANINGLDPKWLWVQKGGKIDEKKEDEDPRRRKRGT